GRGEMAGGYIQRTGGAGPFLPPNTRSGANRAWAMTWGARSSPLPEVRSPAELGSPAINSDNWYGLVAPAGTPPEVLDKLRRATVSVLSSAELKKQFDSQNAVPSPTTPAEFAAFVQAEQAKWGPVVRATGAKLD